MSEQLRIELIVRGEDGFPFRSRFTVEPDEDLPQQMKELGRSIREYHESGQAEQAKAEYAARHADDPTYDHEELYYPPDRDGADTDLLRYLQNAGLLYLINETILHPRGLAIAVDAVTDEVAEDNTAGTVRGLRIVATDDPDGIVFDNAARARARGRLRRSGNLRGPDFDSAEGG